VGEIWGRLSRDIQEGLHGGLNVDVNVIVIVNANVIANVNVIGKDKGRGKAKDKGKDLHGARQIDDGTGVSLVGSRVLVARS
jgi:hypothetical protein